MLVALDRCTEDQIRAHLQQCDREFTPPLSTRVDIAAYACRIRQRAVTIEAWVDEQLVGLVAAYVAPTDASCFVTSVSVLREHAGNGIATRLLRELFELARQLSITRIDLEVSKASARARKLYAALGFADAGERGDFALMTRAERPTPPAAAGG